MREEREERAGRRPAGSGQAELVLRLARVPGDPERVCICLGGELRRGGGRLAVCDVRGLAADAAAIDALARLRLVAHRNGCRLRLRHASPELLELLDLMGLGGVLAPE